MNSIVYSEPYKLPAGILAVVVHGLFFAMLYVGFSMQSPKTIEVASNIEAELWDKLPESKPTVVAEPTLQKVTPPEVTPPEVVKPQPEEPVKPEIILHDKKKPKPKKVEIKKPEVKKPEIKKPEAKKPEVKKPEVKKVESKKVAAQNTNATQLSSKETAISAAEQQAGIERAAQEAAKKRAVDATGQIVGEFTGKIKQKIKRNIVMPPDVADNAQAIFQVTLLPDGSVMNTKLTKSSGNAAYDNAVERAILKSQPLPLPPDTTLFKNFRDLELKFKPVE